MIIFLSFALTVWQARATLRGFVKKAEVYQHLEKAIKRCMLNQIDKYVKEAISMGIRANEPILLSAQKEMKKYGEEKRYAE